MRKFQNVYAVVLAGGSGTRFWPLSRAARPKQFLNITGGGTLFEQTLARAGGLARPENIFVVTSKNFKTLVRGQSKAFRIPARNFLWEPSGRNTAPAICWAAAKIHARDPRAVMAVLPSDHLILKPGNFLACLRRAVEISRKGYLVALGVPPTRPETGYGYLQTRPVKEDGLEFCRVVRFKEKPALPAARRFVKSPGYLWNSGMFVWTAERILAEFQALLPRVYRLVGRRHGQAHIDLVWNRLPGVSVDYGILEKAGRVAAVPAPDIGWSDLGSWEALAEILKSGGHNNMVKGRVATVDTTGSLIWSDKKVVGVAGLENFVVVDTPDALLVCPLDRSQKVKDVVKELGRKYPAVL
jgi:mannose-1-phosphate guanylyltransferase/mannose-6-phosphate isomerase